MNNSDDSKKGMDARSDDTGDSANRNTSSSISDPVMTIGRDAMNLADFPLTLLASRPPKGVTSLVFEDEVGDKHGRNRVKRQLTVLACSEYGLPTASDDEVILGLIQLTYAADFADRKLSFTPAELFRVLGWRNEGRSYARLENSLKRWVGATLYYVNAWRDNGTKAWVDEHFHLLNSVAVPRHQRRSGRTACNGRRLPWTIIWNETVFKSFQDGYIRELDLGVLRRLKTAAAKRMYRFLDRRLYKTDRLTSDLRAFACERIGFSRAYDNSQLKRKLDHAIQELEQVEFLEPLPKEQRYRQVRWGEWKVTFMLTSKWKENKQERSDCTPLEAVLMDRGVKRRMAATLVRVSSHEAIRQCVREHDELLMSERGASFGNPPGLLVKKIRQRCGSNYAARCRKLPINTKRDTLMSQKTPASSEPAGREGTQRQRQLEAIYAYLQKLSPEERESLEASATKSADQVHRDGYARALAEGAPGRIEQYRNMIIESHVLRVLRTRISCV